jgi:GntR family transcriptional regulator of vanillate catabolism
MKRCAEAVQLWSSPTTRRAPIASSHVALICFKHWRSFAPFRRIGLTTYGVHVPLSALTPLERTPSLTQLVFSRLRDAIVHQQLKPGSPLVIDHLATLLGVSRTPIREALPALTQMGLIAETQAGLRVAPLDATYAWEVYAVRSALEALAIEVVTPVLTKADLAALRVIAFPVEPRPDGDYLETVGPGLGFHDFIRARCPLTFINAMLDAVHVHRDRLDQVERQASGDYRRASYQEHQAIYAALTARDAQLARRLMQQHLDRIGVEIATVAPRPLVQHIFEGE